MGVYFSSWHIIAILVLALVLGIILGTCENRLATQPYQRWWRVALLIEALLCLTAKFNLGNPWQGDILFAFILAGSVFMTAFVIAGMIRRCVT